MKRFLVVAAVGTACLLLVAALTFVGLRLTYLGYHWIPQEGMYPTMPAGTRVLGWRAAYENVNDVERGDVVLFVWERDGKSFQVIWRVLALPGDRIRFEDGVPVLNGEPLPQDEQRSEGSYLIVREHLGSTSYEVAYDFAAKKREMGSEDFVVPESHLFLVGDNRDHSFDSREMGAVPFSSVREKVIWSN